MTQAKPTYINFSSLSDNTVQPNVEMYNLITAIIQQIYFLTCTNTGKIEVKFNFLPPQQHLPSQSKPKTTTTATAR